jgi:hypothetical protein
VLSLGTSLNVAGVDTGVWMPWALLHPLPILDHVISTRFWVFALLAIAILVALWLAEPSPRERGQLGGGRRQGGAVDPEPLIGLLERPSHESRLLYHGRKDHLREAEIVLALPYARFGASMLWQAETGMHFKMARGLRIAAVPARLPQRPVLDELLGEDVAAEDVEGQRDFLTRRGLRR